MSVDHNAEASILNDNIQKIISHTQVVFWPDTKLSTAVDYVRWSGGMLKKIKPVGNGLAHYYENGTTGFEGRADAEYVDMLKASYDALIDLFLFSSVSERLGDRLKSRGLHGYSGIVYLKKQYGTIPMIEAVHLVKSLYTPSPRSRADYDNLFDTVETLNITPEQLRACRYLAGWSIQNGSIEEGIERVILAYFQYFGNEFNDFTAENLADIILKLFPTD